MPDRSLTNQHSPSSKAHHRIAIPHFSKHHEREKESRDGAKSPLSIASNNGSGGKRSFLGFTIGKHDSSDSLTSPVMTNTSEHHHVVNQNISHVRQNSEEEPHGALKSNHSSMVELKRFFRPSRKNSQTKSRDGKHDKDNLFFKDTRTHSPSDGSRSVLSPSSSAAQPPAQPFENNPAAAHPVYHPNSSSKDPFDVDGSLVRKYGKLGKILGSGAGGSVRLLTRESDGVTFAVKEFRQRRANEPLKEYAKKCTAEFCIGSTLHHPNVIKTLDILNEGDRYFEVMEFCPIDFFAVVMSGKMSRNELNCCLKQILEGVHYLHQMGLAHRDLKLDNCVITGDGILKLIDFGSAVVFRYPFEDHVVRARGIVGSDPYLAPEVLKLDEYDPQPVDIWSIAIIYCCMTLRRFPWKAPKSSDQSFKLYSLPDDQPHDYIKSNEQHKLLLHQRKLKTMLDKQSKQIEEIRRGSGDTDVEMDGDSPPDGSNNNNDEECQDSEAGFADHRTGLIHQLEEIDQKLKLLEQEKQEMKVKYEHDRRLIEQHQRDHTAGNGESHPNEEDEKHSTKHKQIHGPYRLMRLLPHASRPVVSQMLNLNPKERITLNDIMKDEWIQSIKCCTMTEAGATINMPGHVHTVVLDEDQPETQGKE